MTTHFFDSCETAYTACQCDDNIQQGDLLVIPREGIIALADTWPFVLVGESEGLHMPKDPILSIQALQGFCTVTGEPLEFSQIPLGGRCWGFWYSSDVEQYGFQNCDPLDYFTWPEFIEITREARPHASGRLAVNW